MKRVYPTGLYDASKAKGLLIMCAASRHRSKTRLGSLSIFWLHTRLGRNSFRPLEGFGGSFCHITICHTIICPKVGPNCFGWVITFLIRAMVG